MNLNNIFNFLFYTKMTRQCGLRNCCCHVALSTILLISRSKYPVQKKKKMSTTVPSRGKHPTHKLYFTGAIMPFDFVVLYYCTQHEFYRSSMRLRREMYSFAPDISGASDYECRLSVQHFDTARGQPGSLSSAGGGSSGTAAWECSFATRRHHFPL